MRQKSRPKICRVTWAIITGVLVGFAGLMVYQLLTDYFQYQSYDQSSTEWVNSLKLPAITICSTNPFNYTRVGEKLRPEELVIFNKAMDALDDFKNTGDTYSFYHVLINIEKPFGSLPILFMSHPKQLVFGEYDYVFDGKGYNIDWDTDSGVYPNSSYAQMTELGLCFDLNDNDNLAQQTGWVKAGLTIDLAANSEDYTCTLSLQGASWCLYATRMRLSCKIKVDLWWGQGLKHSSNWQHARRLDWVSHTGVARIFLVHSLRWRSIPNQWGSVFRTEDSTT